MDMQNVSNLVIPEGEVKTIHDKDSRLLWGRSSYNVKYSGDAAQNGTPSPNNPAPVQTATGEQTVTVSDGTNSQSYTIDLGTAELCKIGNYQDYIYKSGDDWYIHKDCGKYTFTGSENWVPGQYGTNSWQVRDIVSIPYDTSKVQVMSSLFRGVSNNNRGSGNNIIYTSTDSISNNVIYVRNTSITTLQDMQSTTSGTSIYYALATPTDTKITDATLVGQLNSVHQFLTRYGYNSTVSGNLPLIISKTNL